MKPTPLRRNQAAYAEQHPAKKSFVVVCACGHKGRVFAPLKLFALTTFMGQHEKPNTEAHHQTVTVICCCGSRHVVATSGPEFSVEELDAWLKRHQRCKGAAA